MAGSGSSAGAGSTEGNSAENGRRNVKLFCGGFLAGAITVAVGFLVWVLDGLEQLEQGSYES